MAAHEHNWQPDRVMGATEQRCDPGCGSWRCQYVDPRTRQRCPEASVGVLNYCDEHGIRLPDGTQKVRERFRKKYETTTH